MSALIFACMRFIATVTSVKVPDSRSSSMPRLPSTSFSLLDFSVQLIHMLRNILPDVIWNISLPSTMRRVIMSLGGNQLLYILS